jgi:peptidoglycan/xylan/chitin deacetylase (PgdA/CDA1 family)
MKQEMALRALTLSGVTELRWRFLRQGLYCFNYHRVGDPKDTLFDRGVFSCTRDNFAAQLDLILERFTLIGLKQLGQLLDGDGSSVGTRPLAMITFDDGYIDNYALAFPALRARRAVATFFLPTSFIGSRQIPWWDEIAWTLRHASVDAISLEGHPCEFRVGPGTAERTVVGVLRLVKSRAGMSLADQVSEIREACRPAGRIDTVADPLFMTWDQAREMQSAGMDIGSHTHSHPILSHVSSDVQRAELVDSKHMLEAELQAPITAIAYPVGKASSYTAETCRLAEEAGYHCGFDFEPRVNDLPLKSRFAIGRFASDGDRNRQRMKAAIAFPNI